MSKTLFTLVVLCISIVLAMSTAYAGEKSTFNFGPKGGVNINYQWDGDIPTLGDSYAGFVAGLFLRMRLLSFLMIQPELLYSQQGSSNLHIDYLQIPVLVKLGIPLGSVTPLVFAGPVGAFKVNDDSDISDFIDVKDALFSIAMGAGVDIDIGKFLLTLEGRWTFSTTDSVTTDTPVLEASMKNGTGSFIIGFGF